MLWAENGNKMGQILTEIRDLYPVVAIEPEAPEALVMETA
jgi:hypothetical protein